jgi:hypothetical protein
MCWYFHFNITSCAFLNIISENGRGSCICIKLTDEEDIPEEEVVFIFFFNFLNYLCLILG